MRCPKVKYRQNKEVRRQSLSHKVKPTYPAGILRKENIIFILKTINNIPQFSQHKRKSQQLLHMTTAVWTPPHTHPDCGYSGGQRGHSVSVAGAHGGAVGADELLLGATEPVQLRLMLHAELTLSREDPGLGVGGRSGWARHRGVPRPLLLLPSAAQHGENRLLTIHRPGFHRV